MRLTGASFVRVAAKVVAEGSSAHANKLYVSNLHWITGKKQLEEHFSKFGKIASINIPMDFDRGTHKGYGFVSYTSPEALKKATSAGSRHRIDNKLADVRKFN